jgi:hypothetical protein
MNSITISLNVSDFLAYAFLGFLTILAVKLAIAVGAFIFLPALDGQNFWAGAAMLLNITSRWFLSLVLAVIVALLVCLAGGPLVIAVLICAFAAAVGSFV